MCVYIYVCVCVCVYAYMFAYIYICTWSGTIRELNRKAPSLFPAASLTSPSLVALFVLHKC